MFRPKQPFEGQEAIEAQLSEINDDGLTVISSQCISFAKERPDDFLNYLRHAWKQYGPTLRKDEALLEALQKVEVTRPGGGTASLVSLYLPFPKLVYLRNRYLLPHESFRLLLSEYEITADADLESWTALADDIGLVRDDDGMFYIDLLAALKSNNENGEVEFPRRVLELYLRIQAACDVKGGEAVQKMTREWFIQDPMLLTGKGWCRLTECYLEILTDISRIITSPIILPPPKSWDVSSFELAALEKFYRKVLQIGNSSLDAVLKELDKKPDFHHSKKLYDVLGKISGKLPMDDLKRLRAYFKANQCIILSEGDTKRYSVNECVWAPKLNCPENLYDHLPELHLFFTGVAEVPETDIGRVYDELVNLASWELNFGESKKEPAIRLLVALSQDIEKYGRYVNKEKLLGSEIFPLAADGRLPKMCSASTNFYIMDREDYQTKFRHKIPVLDIDQTTFWLLQPFFLWAGLEDRYLKANLISIHTKFDLGSVVPPYMHELRAKGLLRLAVHYKSPQTLNAADNSISSHLKIKSIEGSQARPSYPEVVVLQGDSYMEICLEKRSAEVATAVQLPVELASVLMADPMDESKSIRPVDETLIGFIRTIFRINNHNLPSIKMILDEEGIVDVDKLQNSPYIPENDQGRLSRLLADRRPDRMFGKDPSRPNQKPKTAWGDGQNDDVTQQLSSLSLQGKQDETDTSWSSDSTKETLV